MLLRHVRIGSARTPSDAKMLHPSGPERKLCGRENLVCYVEIIELGVYVHENDDDLVNKSTFHHKIGTKVSPSLGTRWKWELVQQYKMGLPAGREKNTVIEHNFATIKSICFSSTSPKWCVFAKNAIIFCIHVKIRKENASNLRVNHLALTWKEILLNRVCSSTIWSRIPRKY